MGIDLCEAFPVVNELVIAEKMRLLVASNKRPALSMDKSSIDIAFMTHEVQTSRSYEYILYMVSTLESRLFSLSSSTSVAVSFIQPDLLHTRSKALQ
jgi:hypothetical protein